MRRVRAISLFAAITIFISACTPFNIPHNTPASLPEVYPYPGMDLVQPTGPYPATAPTAQTGGPPFVIHKPLRQGDTKVSGTGPAGVPLILQDITLFGEILAETKIDADGTFLFTVKPLPAKHRVGITLNRLANTNWKPEDFFAPCYYGDEAMVIPGENLYYDTAFVTPSD